MLQTIITIVAVCGIAHSSGVHEVASIANAPVVTASSSQYFERTFNRLVAPPVLVQPASRPQFVPVQTVPVQPVQNIQPVPTYQSVIPVQSTQSLPPAQPLPSPQPVEPNVAIAIATANAAAPVATILLPPYPFGFPPSFGFISQEQPRDGDREETTTQPPTTQAEVNTTREPEATTQIPDSSDNNAVQALPSNQDESQVKFRQYSSPLPTNQNVNFQQYGVPLQSPSPSNQEVNFKQYLAPNQIHQLPLALPQPHHHHHHHHHHPHKHLHVHPLKLKTSVEIQRVPLAYIAPPPLPHFENNHQAIKVVKHIHSFVPSKAKLIIRPVLKTRSTPTKHAYKVSNEGYKGLRLKNIAHFQNARNFNMKENEHTIRSLPIQNTKPLQ